MWTKVDGDSDFTNIFLIVLVEFKQGFFFLSLYTAEKSLE